MSKIEDLEKKLYQKDDEVEQSNDEEFFNKEKPFSGYKKAEWQKLAEDKKFFTSRQKNLLILAIVSLLFISSIIFGLLKYYGHKSFIKDNVFVSIKGPEKIISGENVRFNVNYKNKTEVVLKDVKISFFWPKNSELLNNKSSESFIAQTAIEQIPIGYEGSIVFEGRIFGSKDNEFNLGTSLNYQPENISSSFENKNEFKTKIISTPISLEMKMPSLAVNGREFEFEINYLNLSSESFSNIQLKTEYPVGFSFVSSSPSPSENNNIWNFSKLVGRESGKVKIVGTLNGFQNETKMFASEVGILFFSSKGKDQIFVAYTKEDSSIMMSSSALVVFQTVENQRNYAASVGQTLNYKINYRNTSDVPISNVIIKASLFGNVLDFKTLNVKWGFLDSKTNSLVWNSASNSDLAVLNPQEEGEVFFSVKLKNELPVFSQKDKNFIISSKAEIDSLTVPDALVGIPIGSNDSFDVKINSFLSFVSKGYYQNELISNDGPIPPKVGQKTTYTIIWQLANYSNDLNDVVIEAVLPPYVEWTGKVYPDNSQFSFDSLEGKLIFKLDNLKAGSGVYFPAEQIAFQLALTPTINQIGQTLDLVSQVKFSALDSFTKNEINIQKEKIMTDLSRDPSLGQGGGTVAE